MLHGRENVPKGLNGLRESEFSEMFGMLGNETCQSETLPTLLIGSLEQDIKPLVLA